MLWIELIISLTILIIVGSFSFTQSWLLQHRLQIRAIEITQAVHMAKSLATLRLENLKLASLSNSSDWSNGMKLLSSDDHCLYVWRWSSEHPRVTWQGFQAVNYLIFSPELSHNRVNGTFVLQESTLHWKLIINRLGRVRTSK